MDRTMRKWAVILAVVIWLIGHDNPVLFPDADLVVIQNNVCTVFKGQDALASVSMDWVFIVRVGDFIL